MAFSINACGLQKWIVKVRKLNKNAGGELEEHLQSIKDFLKPVLYKAKENMTCFSQVSTVDIILFCHMQQLQKEVHSLLISDNSQMSEFPVLWFSFKY